MALTLTGRVEEVRPTKPSQDGKYPAGFAVRLLDWGEDTTLFCSDDRFTAALGSLKPGQEVAVAVKARAMISNQSGLPRLSFVVAGPPRIVPAQRA